MGLPGLRRQVPHVQGHRRSDLSRFAATTQQLPRNSISPAIPELPEITATDTGLWIAGEEFAFDAVTTVSYVKQVRRASGVVTDVWRRFELETDGRRRAVKLDGAKVAAEQKQELWARLVAISQSAIEPRLRNLALERLQRYGETVAIGRLTLTREGFAWRGPLRQKRYPWSQHHRTFFNTDRIRVVAQAPGESARPVGDIGTEVPNAVLLPRLMSACVDAFGQR